MSFYTFDQPASRYRCPTCGTEIGPYPCPTCERNNQLKRQTELMQEQSRRQEEMAKEQRIQRIAEQQQREYAAEDPVIRQIRNAYWAGKEAGRDEQIRIYEKAEKARQAAIRESRGFVDSVKYYTGYCIGRVWRATWFTLKVIFCIILFALLWSGLSALMGIH